MSDFIIIAIVGIIVAAAIYYIYKSKKNGVKCIGCPSGKSCSGKCGGQSDCHCGNDTDTPH